MSKVTTPNAALFENTLPLTVEEAAEKMNDVHTIVHNFFKTHSIKKGRSALKSLRKIQSCNDLQAMQQTVAQAELLLRGFVDLAIQLQPYDKIIKAYFDVD